MLERSRDGLVIERDGQAGLSAPSTGRRRVCVECHEILGSPVVKVVVLNSYAAGMEAMMALSASSDRISKPPSFVTCSRQRQHQR